MTSKNVLQYAEKVKLSCTLLSINSGSLKIRIVKTVGFLKRKNIVQYALSAFQL